MLLGLLVGLPAGYSMVSYQAGSLSGDGLIVGDGNLVVLMPDEWAGKPFPLVQHIDVGPQLTQGHWLVVLYHLGCPECEKLVAKYREMCQSPSASRCQVALIEVPEPGQSSNKLDLPSGGCLLGRMSAAREWFVQTPAVLLVENGRVRQAYEGSAEKFFTLLGNVSTAK